MTFEEELKKLNTIAEKLNEEIGLEESIKIYEEGIRLSKKLTKDLDEMKRKVEVLTDSDELKEFTL